MSLATSRSSSRSSADTATAKLLLRRVPRSVDRIGRHVVHVGPAPVQGVDHPVGEVDGVLEPGLADLGKKGAALLRDDRAGQRVLGGEVEVDGALGDPGPLDDLGHGGCLVSVCADDVGRRFEDGAPGAHRAFLLGH